MPSAFRVLEAGRARTAVEGTALLVHSVFIDNGFTAADSGHQPLDAAVVPEGWRQDGDNCCFWYRHPQSSMRFEAKIVGMGKSAVVLASAPGAKTIARVTLDAAEICAADGTPQRGAAGVVSKACLGLLAALVPGVVAAPPADVSSAQLPLPAPKAPPDGNPMAPPFRHPTARPEPVLPAGPMPYGRGDLVPGGGVGGMLAGPEIFGGGQPAVHIGPDGLPVRPGPAGARFDPPMPPGLGGQQGSQPDPDGLPPVGPGGLALPPGQNTMFM
eukprot:TRINITY_DN39937_c0_g1_i1.p2 TRINITY_DN39937_c0_g1~~TRINITY_DN39937_c0_g1_i1.p2  ORF type:complete len:271 (+),score=55.71 TRINITY_DN39937_c0_g1_i1:82-894(+)